MTFKTVLKAAEKFVSDNSPGILTGLAIAGTVTTAILSSKASIEAVRIFNEKYGHLQNADGQISDKFVPPNKKEIVDLVWKLYIPAAVSGTATITCIIAANHIGSRRTAAIAAAFKISEQLTEEYKDRVVKTLGAQKEEKMRSELAGDRMARAGGGETIIISGPESVFYDDLSGRFFKNEMEKVRKAVNDINHQVNNSYYASLSDFYDLIGLDRTGFSDEVGWNTDGLMDVQFAATLLSDGRPAIAMSYNTTPIRGYDRCQ